MSKKENYKLALIIVLGALIVSLAYLSSQLFNFSLVENLVMGWVMTILFAVFAFLVSSDIVVREKIIEKPVIKEVIKEVPIQIPIENRTIEVVEKPVEVIKEIVREIPMPVRVARSPTINANAPRYIYIGSAQTKTYHKRSCRLGKLIKRKYKLSSMNKSFFKRKHFRACKSCLQRKK